MKDRTTLLSGLGEFEVVEVDRLAADAVRVVIETVAREAAYPECGTLSTRVKDLPLSRVKDLLVSGQRVELWWRKRRLLCLPSWCPRRSFLERTVAIPQRSIDQRVHGYAAKRSGRTSNPRSIRLFLSTASPASARVPTLADNSSNTTLPINLATGAPRQKCVPRPKAR